ncbi:MULTISPECIES: helix-turn-helix transcriptional regulator [unclassified Methylophaga]|jgi:DNA-binding transcriptional ArsR family regulator|uniref:ArsR/SmtB family transcription factor n=1 Tax=unclassified Methylophaga TaxID=2629249 RepID=UPI000C8B99DB|nr:MULTISPECIES: helix-turn-helix transcriptional regulator [unclassified Methylophaga]MAK67103.1 transcriptional regulator [Methylophaga sp.]MAY18141.1 transcriptional regulator [Methylophaga sp.]MBN45564.1 transcriptional regulator [Methylophaga sp.]HAO24404.1 transcriptional regulator [Methylophaga sp.]HCD06353.1 transcriptional regulator [Methylophaga sp.]|tara:strand:- start:47490 stop:47813 length:324 start_codon:yes stop_codon:yes gene_type:complete
MTHDEAALSLAELGNSSRLAIFRYLVKAGHEGVPVGDIQRSLAIPGSTLSHHLTKMAHADLIIQDKKGRSICCKPNFPHLEKLMDYLKEECCQGHQPPETETNSCDC